MSAYPSNSGRIAVFSAIPGSQKRATRSLLDQLVAEVTIDIVAKPVRRLGKRRTVEGVEQGAST